MSDAEGGTGMAAKKRGKGACDGFRKVQPSPQPKRPVRAPEPSDELVADPADEDVLASEHARLELPVAGLVASAGGLDAFKKFFTAMPADSGIAFVLIPHLDPDARKPDGRAARPAHVHAGRRGRGRHGRRGQPRLHHPAEQEHDHLWRSAPPDRAGASAKFGRHRSISFCARWRTINWKKRSASS